MEIAIIGLGYWGSKLKFYLEENPNFNLKYLCDSKSDLNEVWADNEVEAVVVATRNDSHYELTKRALDSGKHVLVEKPLALKEHQALKIKRLAREKGLSVVTDYVFTFSKCLEVAQNTIAQGDIGKLLGAEFTSKHLGRFGGGSVYWLLGSHWLSVLDMFVPIETLTFSKRDLVNPHDEVESGVISYEGKAFAGQISVSLNYPGKEVMAILYGENYTVAYNPLVHPALTVACYDRPTWKVAAEIPKRVNQFNYDESHNLRYTVEYLWSVLSGYKEDNLDRSVKVTQIIDYLEKIKHQSVAISID